MIIKWSLAMLAVSAMAGIGAYVFGALDFIRNRGGETRRILMVVSLALLAVGLVVNILGIGNPARILNILAHITSPFSFTTVGVAALCVLLLAVVFKYGPKTPPNALFIAGLVLSAVIYCGISMIFAKPSRAALHHWFLPLYIVSVSILIGSYMQLALNKLLAPQDNGCRVARLITMVCAAASMTAFAVNLHTSGIADKYLSKTLINGEMFLPFYGGAVFIGLVVPLAMENFANKKSSAMAPSLVALAGLVIGALSFFSIVCIIQLAP